MKAPKSTELPRVLFVDDELPVLKSLKRFGRSKDWDISIASSGAEALSIMDDIEFDVIVSDMRMPEMSGSEFLAQVLEKRPSAIRILLTGYSDLQALESAINDAKIHSYITKPWDDFMLGETIDGALRYVNSEKERVRLLELTEIQNKKLSRLAISLDRKVKERTSEIEQIMAMLQVNNQNVENNFFESLTIFSHIVEWNEGRDSGHSRFVAEYGEKLAGALELPQEEIQNTRVAAMLHRIGVLALPDGLRSKPVFLLDADEQKQYRQLPTLGEMALTSAPSLQVVAKIIRHQYEWVNGKGYPDQLTDRDIPIVSKIIAIVSDFYDVFNGRLERNMSGIEDAKTYLSSWSGKKYDKKIVDAFLEVLGDFGQTCIKVVAKFSKDLTAGLELESDIVTKSGILLLKKNTRLNETHIEKIKSHEERFGEVFVIRVLVDER